MPINIKAHDLRDQVTYFISNQHTKKGLNPNIHVIDSIYNIKGKSTLHIIVVNYTNKHVTFNKGQCIGHMERQIDNIPQTCHQCHHTENDGQTSSPGHCISFPGSETVSG